MTDKYKVSKKVMNEINDWKTIVSPYVADRDIFNDVIGRDIQNWWRGENNNYIEMNRRLIALIRYVNGEDVFEVEQPKKWIVKSSNQNDSLYLTVYDKYGSDLLEYHGRVAIGMITTIYDYKATRFNTKEEAEQFTNPLMEAVEVEDD